MKTETLHRREIWSKWLRLSHWTLALSTLALMATGWLIHHTPSVAQAAADWHYIAGSIFTLGLALRIWVLFSDKRMGHWRFLLPDLEPKKMLQMLKFYLSFGKATLPRWYAHNPLWLPIYLVLLLLMVLAAFTGTCKALIRSSLAFICRHCMLALPRSFHCSSWGTSSPCSCTISKAVATTCQR